MAGVVDQGVQPDMSDWHPKGRLSTGFLRWLWRAVLSVAAVLIPLGVAAALVPVRSGTPNATIALILAVVVILVSATVDRVSAALAAVSAALMFDVWFTHPYGSLSISRAQDIETTALLLAIALSVGQLAARSRRHQSLAMETSYNLARVHAVAEMVASGSAADQVVIAVATELRSLLCLRSCWYDEAFAARPGPFIERNGGVSWGAIRWGSSTMGMPASEVTLTVEHEGRPLGRFVLLAFPGGRVTEDELLAAVALSDQAGAALAAEGRLAS